MPTKTRTIPAHELRAGHTITNSGTAVEGKTVADVRETSDGFAAGANVWVEVVFTDGSTWDLESWGSDVNVRA